MLDVLGTKSSRLRAPSARLLTALIAMGVAALLGLHAFSHADDGVGGHGGDECVLCTVLAGFVLVLFALGYLPEPRGGRLVTPAAVLGDIPAIPLPFSLRGPPAGHPA